MTMHLPSFESAKVLVVGDLMLDRYWHGGTSRISPEAPVPVVHVNQNEERAGGACNVALNIATLGAQCTVTGLCGDDEAARTLEKLLENIGVKAQFVRMPENSTVTKLRVMSRSQQLMRLDLKMVLSDRIYPSLKKHLKHNWKITILLFARITVKAACAM